MPGKRDNAYWLGRLKAEHPAIYAKFKAGKIASVRQACAEAELIHLPNRVDALKREWKGATHSQQVAILWCDAAATYSSTISKCDALCWRASS